MQYTIPTERNDLIYAWGTLWCSFYLFLGLRISLKIVSGATIKVHGEPIHTMLHTYTHNCPLQACNQDYGLASTFILLLRIFLKIMSVAIIRVNGERILSTYHIMLYTYIHNWPLQPCSQDYGLASHITHVVGVNFMRKQRELQFNVDSEQQIFEKLFHGRFILLSEFLSEICWEEIGLEIFFFFFIFRFAIWPGIPTRALLLITCYQFFFTRSLWYWCERCLVATGSCNLSSIYSVKRLMAAQLAEMMM